MEPAADASLSDAPLRRARLAILLSLIATLVVMANVGTILSANLAKDHPVALLALSARNRHLLLAVAAGIGAVPYAAVSSVRLLIPAVAFFLLGTWYGDRGLRWLERQAGGTPATVRGVEGWVDRARPPIVVLMVGSKLVGPAAGPRRMAARTYGIVLASGILVRLAFFWFLGK